MAQEQDQELFDEVCKAVIAQGEPSARVREGNVFARVSCQYRMEKDGKVLKCAAGHLIPDDKYSLEIEGRRADRLAKDGILADVDPDFILRLQGAHDGAADASLRSDDTFDNEVFLVQFRKRAAEVAAARQLNADVLK